MEEDMGKVMRLNEFRFERDIESKIDEFNYQFS